jgi:hypothetical protein
MNFLQSSSEYRRNCFNGYQSLFPDRDVLKDLITADIHVYEKMTQSQRKTLRTKLAGEFNLSAERLNVLLREGPQFLPSRELNSPTVALYLNDFVEWDMEQEEYVSHSNPNQRETKLAYVKDIDNEGPSYLSREIEFIHSVEQDIKVRKKLQRLLL